MGLHEIFCRINLSRTNYTKEIIKDWSYIKPVASDIVKFNNIYKQYCEYKQFSSVMPIFDKRYFDADTDILGYYYNKQLVAFSLVKKWDSKNVESWQFAWDYANPELQYGHKSLMLECAIYKEKGFDYLYLGPAADYKSKLDGYEIVGKLNV